MSDTRKDWTLQGFVNYFDFVHHNMPDHKFVWMLGAGASVASKIPSGGELVDRWLDELRIRAVDQNIKIEDWATEENLEISEFDYEKRASFYSKIYDRRFEDNPQEGYAYLESVMADADPSPGYSILAAALAGDPPKRQPRHNAVVTTNFDNLVADALSIYTDTFPFVCGHESLTSFVNVAMRRPVVCKIHRDLLLAPQNDSRSMIRLHDAWGMALRALFEHYTPLFIGYGGNDDTLMDLLKSLEPDEIKGRMIWCYYEKSQPSERIVKLVNAHKGILVPVPDFDLLMVLLGEKMGISLLDEEIGKRAEARTQQYRDRILQLDTVKHPEVTQALAATFNRSGGPWVWEQKARSEEDIENREVVYRQGIQHYPESAELHNNFALFLTDLRDDHDEAEKHFRKCLELNPKAAIASGNFAKFMEDERGDLDEAQRLYRKALELDPKNAIITSNFADFMQDVSGDLDETEWLYRKSLELDPEEANTTGKFADFMTDVRGDHEEAEQLYRKALELDPNHAGITSGFAYFMTKVRGDHEEAERLHRKALELDPQNAFLASNFANFIWKERGDHDEAERLFRKAIELDPNHPNLNGNYAAFLLSRGRLVESANMLKEAEGLLEVKHGNRFAAKIALISAILAGVRKKDDTYHFDTLRNSLNEGFTRIHWNLDNVLSFGKKQVSSKNFALYSAFVEAYNDEKKVPAALALLDKRASFAKAAIAKKRTTKKKAAKKKTRKKTPTSTPSKRAKSKKPPRK